MRLDWLPNALSLSRALLGLVVAGAVLAGGAGAGAAPGLWPQIALAAFLLAAATDGLDGMLARRLDAGTPFGAWLDPIADKVLVACSLIALCLATRESVLILASAVIIARDVAVSGLRARHGGGLAVPVTALAKWKTAAELAAIALLLAAPAVEPAAHSGGGLSGAVWQGGLILLALAAALSLFTGWQYWRGVQTNRPPS